MLQYFGDWGGDRRLLPATTATMHFTRGRMCLLSRGYTLLPGSLRSNNMLTGGGLLRVCTEWLLPSGLYVRAGGV